MVKVKKITNKRPTKRTLQKNVISAFSVEELLSRAQDEIDAFHYKQAQLYCQEALKRDPDNLKALEISANLCLETGNLDGAKHCLGRAITLAPENGFIKYLSLGQLLEGKDSLQSYLKGIELIKQEINKSKKDETEFEIEEKENNCKDNISDDNVNVNKSENAQAEPKSEEESLNRKLSNAYSAIAELYMSDLCDEEEAEAESCSNIQKAIQSDPENPEAYQHHVSRFLVKKYHIHF